MVNGVPPNIEELKKKANNQQSWRERLSAVNELKNYDCQQSRDILTRLALHDIVFCVKEAAFRATQAMGVTKNGKPIYLSKKPKGNLVKKITKLKKLRKNCPVYMIHYLTVILWMILKRHSNICTLLPMIFTMAIKEIDLTNG